MQWSYFFDSVHEWLCTLCYWASMHAFSSRSLEQNRNFDVVLLDAEEYDGWFRKCVFQKEYSRHLFFSFVLAKKKNRWYIWGSITKKDRQILKGFEISIYTMMPVHQSKWGHYCGPNRSHIIKRTRYTRWIFPCVNEMAVEMNDSSDWGESVCCQGIGSSSIISQKVVSCIACDRMSKNVKQRNWEACSYLGELN